MSRYLGLGWLYLEALVPAVNCFAILLYFKIRRGQVTVHRIMKVREPSHATREMKSQVKKFDSPIKLLRIHGLYTEVPPMMSLVLQ